MLRCQCPSVRPSVYDPNLLRIVVVGRGNLNNISSYASHYARCCCCCYCHSQGNKLQRQLRVKRFFYKHRDIVVEIIIKSVGVFTKYSSSCKVESMQTWQNSSIILCRYKLARSLTIALIYININVSF